MVLFLFIFSQFLVRIAGLEKLGKFVEVEIQFRGVLFNYASMEMAVRATDDALIRPTILTNKAYEYGRIIGQPPAYYLGRVNSIAMHYGTGA